MGLKFNYSRNWHYLSEFSRLDESCKKVDIACSVLLSSNAGAVINILALRGHEFEKLCRCNDLLSFIRARYNELTQNASTGFSFINDNRTTIAQKIPSWQMEYNTSNAGALNYSFPIIRNLEIATIANGTHYIIDYQAYQPVYASFLPQVKKIIDSIKFIPAYIAPPPKVPSFMQFQTD